MSDTTTNTRGTSPAAGLKTLLSDFDPKETVARLEAEIKAHGMSVFARFDHAALARDAGLTLRPTEVIVFGNPKAGTPLMNATQTISIELPLKASVWQDDLGKTWLSYNDPQWLAERHGLDDTNRIVAAMTSALGAIASNTTRKVAH